MISLKKVIVAAAVATLGFGLFAQSSKTNAATAGLFDTDVDNFVSVTEWSTVKPEKFFGYFGMDNGRYNVGFAKQFEKFYWGTYYDGNIGTYTKYTNDANSNNKEKRNTTTDATSTANPVSNGRIEFDNLFGFGNIGLKVSTLFTGSKTVEDNKVGDKTVTTTKDTERFEGTVSVGLSNYQLGKFNTKPYAYVIYDTNVYGSTKTEVTNNDTQDYRTKSFSLGAGAEVTLSESETTKQTVSGSFNFANYTPYDSDKADKGTSISLPLSYKVTYKATDALSLAFGANATTSYSTYELSKNKTKDTYFWFTPSVSTGLTFDTKKKVILNAGVDFDVPSYSDSKNERDGKVTETKNWNGSDCDLTWHSGFNWVPTKNISVDCSYEILADLLDDTTTPVTSGEMETNFEEGNNTNFWNTVNQALVHNIGFSVSVKF